MTSETHAPNSYTCSCAQVQFALQDLHMGLSPQGTMHQAGWGHCKLHMEMLSLEQAEG